MVEKTALSHFVRSPTASEKLDADAEDLKAETFNMNELNPVRKLDDTLSVAERYAMVVANKPVWRNRDTIDQGVLGSSIGKGTPESLVPRSRFARGGRIFFGKRPEILQSETLRQPNIERLLSKN